MLQKNNLTFKYIDTNEEAKEVSNNLQDSKYISIDTETNSLDPMENDSKIVLLQLFSKSSVYLIDARKVDLNIFKSVLENSQIVKILQNAKFDFKFLYAKYDITLKNIFDTYLAEKILNAGLNAPSNLKELVKKYCGVEISKELRTSFIDITNDVSFSEEQLQYAADDVIYLPRIMKFQKYSLSELQLEKVSELEFTLIEPVSHMEFTGIKIDVEKWRENLKKVDAEVNRLETELRLVLPDPEPEPEKEIRLKKDGTPFKADLNRVKKPDPVLNFDSWQQIVWAFNKVGINLQSASKVTGKGLTDKSTLNVALAQNLEDKLKSDILKNFIAYRAITQIQQTFGESLLKFVKSDGRIHSEFDQVGTVSGRFSSRHPNVEQIPKKGEQGKLIRSCFVPEKGNKIIKLDYSQLHLRLAAELSGDTSMIEAFNSGGDFHSLTASQMYNIRIDKVSPDQRRDAKTINFAILYGATANTVAQNAGCSRKKAEEMLENYSSAYPELMKWLIIMGSRGVPGARIKSMLGRTRYLPRVSSTDSNYKRVLSFYSRVGKNHPILATDGDMIKLAIIFSYYKLKNYNAKLVNCIHDELLIETSEDKADEVALEIQKIMVSVGEFFIKKVKVIVDYSIGDCW